MISVGRTIIQSTSPNTALVFGLEWKTLVGNKLESRSQKEAIAAKATHYIKAGDHSTAVAVAVLPKEKGQKKKRKLYSAAAIFALSNGNGVFYEALDMPEDKVWVVAAQDGTVISGTDKICTREEAESLTRSLKERYPQIIQISDEDDDFSFYMNEKTQLFETKTAAESIPLWMRYTGAAILAIVVIDTVWSKYQAYQRKKERETNVESTVDAHAEWKQSLDSWEKTIFLGGRQSLMDVYQEILNTPLYVSGWSLSVIDCSAAKHNWDCKAVYIRQTDGTNLLFKNNAKKEWSIGWNGLDQAIASWSIKSERPILDRTRLTPAEDVSLSYISSLQRVLPAFITYQLSAPVKADVPQPIATTRKGEQRVIPYPEDNTKGIEIPSLQKFTLEAPLRSITVLPVIDQTFISRISISVKHDSTDAALTKSMFTAKLDGEFYVKLK